HVFLLCPVIFSLCPLFCLLFSVPNQWQTFPIFFDSVFLVFFVFMKHGKVSSIPRFVRF
ncbi:hypothetical protein AGABI1DRAFT_85846, partial [Agaricus bisporus var. burnettii JB137-S8]